MARWTIPEMDEHTPALVRNAWRKPVADAVIQEQPPETSAAHWRWTVLAGVALGTLGSLTILLLT